MQSQKTVCMAMSPKKKQHQTLPMPSMILSQPKLSDLWYRDVALGNLVRQTFQPKLTGQFRTLWGPHFFFLAWQCKAETGASRGDPDKATACNATIHMGTCWSSASPLLYFKSLVTSLGCNVLRPKFLAPAPVWETRKLWLPGFGLAFWPFE